MKIVRSFILLILLQCASAPIIQAQQCETALWSYLSLSKPLNAKWTVSAQTELRTGDDNTRLYLWYIDSNIRYKINSWLAGSIGFDYIKVHARPTAQRRSVWRTDWRPYIALITSWKMGNMRASLNESMTYNWFPEMEKDGVIIKGRAYYLARHRFTLEYPIKESRFIPYTKLEIRQTQKLERVRVTSGSTIRIDDRQSLDVGYVYQDMHNSTKTHALAIGYRIRL